MDKAYKQYNSDNLLGFQELKPVFVKRPFNAYNKQWKQGEEFNWATYPCREEDQDRIRLRIKQFYDSGYLHHDSNREVQQKVGDRLGELSKEKLISLVRRVNILVKERCTTEKEFQDKRLKQSKIEAKQRGLIRAWLNRNNWAMDEYYEIRDDLLNSYQETPSDNT